LSVKFIIFFSIEPEGKIPELEEQSLEEVIATPGSSVTLEAKSSGYPEPRAVWLKNEIELKPSKNLEISSKDGVHKLTIKSIVFDDDAEYYCQLSNKHGAVEAIFSIIVEEEKTKPSFGKALLDLDIKEGEDAQFNVVVSANPEAEVDWFLGDDLLKDEECCQILVENGNSHTLVLGDCDQEDSGIVRCVARNNLGEESCQCNLQVSRAGTCSWNNFKLCFFKPALFSSCFLLYSLRSFLLVYLIRIYMVYVSINQFAIFITTNFFNWIFFKNIFRYRSSG